MGRREEMRANIHPELKDATVTCACGATFKTKSTKEKINVEVCNECHPFYTGTQSRAKKTGNIEKFNKKYGLNDKQKA
jgi:large subunit ribosomal protein L31